MSYLHALILGFFQGVTEFLPISSSGHLALLQQLFNIKEGNLFFTEMLHFGTLISIFVVYFKDVINIVKEFFILVKDSIKDRRIIIKNKYQKLGLLIILASIPTAIIGLLFEDFFQSLYNTILPIGIAFLVTGTLLYFVNNRKEGKKDVKETTFIDSIIIGIFQGLAIFPGISRSGTTIATALFRDFKKPLATEFSFLLAMPAIFGASLLGIIKAFKSQGDMVYFSLPLLVGVATSAIVGVFSIKLLINSLKNKKLHYFAIYLWLIGLFTIGVHVFN